MRLDRHAETEWFCTLPPERRARFLAHLSHNLTIVLRFFCHAAGDLHRNLEVARSINEAHHRIAGYLSHCLSGTEDLGWAGPTFSFIFMAEDPMLLHQYEQAWKSSRLSIAAQSL